MLREMSYSRNVKCVVVGDGDVGKTSLLMSYTCNTLSDDYVPTVFQHLSKNLVIDGLTLNLGIWETPGKEEYSIFRPLHYQGVNVYVIAFSLVSYASFENVSKKWIHEARHYAEFAPIVLVGTKLDLRDDAHFFLDHPEAFQISTTQGERLKENIGAVAYVECSPKMQQNVNAVFDSVIQAALRLPKSIKQKKECCTLM